MNGFEQALGWYKVTTPQDYEIVLERKALELVNFNPNGSSCFKDSEGMLYLLKTHKISSMSPYRKSSICEQDSYKCEFGIGLLIYSWCKASNLPFLKEVLRASINKALDSVNGKIYCDDDLNRKTLEYYWETLNLPQYRGKRFSHSDAI